MGSTNSTSLSNNIDERYELTEWTTSPGVTRLLPKKFKNVPSEQNLSLFELYSNFSKFIAVELAIKAQSSSMFNFLVNSVVDPVVEKT